MTSATPNPGPRHACWLPGLVIAALLLPSIVLAALPEPTPEQQRAAAEKKTQAGQQAEQDKQALLAKMNEVAERWRARAGENGWKTHPPTPVQQSAGIDASTKQSGSSGQPGGSRGDDARRQPIRSEKHGTAPASEDVKQPARPQSGAATPDTQPRRR